VNNALSDEFSSLFGLPRGNVRFRTTVGLAFCSREPCRSVAMLLEPGQPVHLQHLPECQPDAPIIQVCVDHDDDRITGSLYAVDAAMLSILFRYGQRNDADRLLLADRSILQTIIKQAPADQPGARRLRYPKATLHLDLEMSEAWPLFTVLALLKIKDEIPLSPVVLNENPWLQPILDLQKDYRTRGHDRFRLPRALSLAWFELTRF